MSGIYIHIPFCKQACIYCNFHFSLKDNFSEIVSCILTEIELNQKKITKNKISSIYFGGGTPSLISINQLKNILNCLIKNHELSPECEITIEVNPDDATIENIKSWKNIGFNRISLGIQTFDDKHLKVINRAHNSKQGISAIKNVKREFKNFSIDLMFGIPGSTIQKLNNDLKMIKKYEPPHISIYSLDVEKKTKLYKMIKGNKIELPSDKLISNQFDLIFNEMDRMGYINYEISSFCKNGFKSKHNSKYWSNEKYLGYGPGAHSYDKKFRYWNVNNNIEYVKKIRDEVSVFEKEELTETQKINEYIMTKMRTIEGINFRTLNDNMKFNLVVNKKKEIEFMKKINIVKEKNKNLVLTNEGKKNLDYVIEKLTI